MSTQPTGYTPSAQEYIDSVNGVSHQSAVTIIEKLDGEIAELREKVENLSAQNTDEYSHQCIKCFHNYNPKDGHPEHCPKCGCEG